MKTKMKTQNKKTLISALLLLIGLVVIFGVAVLLKTRNFNDQSRASSGTIMVGTLISANSSLCTKCVQQCPGTDNILRNCNPMESDGTSIDSMCNMAGRVETCGTNTFCCPKPNAQWTTDLTKCPGVTPPVKTPSPFRLLKSGGVCTALVVSKTIADPLVGKSVVATGSLKEPYFYASRLALNTCVQQCPGVDKILRNCTPPKSDGTSKDSLCNIKGRVELCGGVKFCCPGVGAQWTTDMTKCPVSTTTPTKTPTPTTRPTSTPTPTPSDNRTPQINTASLPTGTVNEPYGASVNASDPNVTDQLQMTISGLPFGLNTGPCGAPVGGGRITCNISGAPVNAGYYSVHIVVTDNHGGSANRTIPLRIVKAAQP